MPGMAAGEPPGGGDSLTFETVLYEAADGIARITMNRPEKHNALNHQMMDDLDAAFAKAGADDTVSAVILKGNGPSFCSGYDLKGGSYYITPPRDAEKWNTAGVLEALAHVEAWYRR